MPRCSPNSTTVCIAVSFLEMIQLAMAVFGFRSFGRGDSGAFLFSAFKVGLWQVRCRNIQKAICEIYSSILQNLGDKTAENFVLIALLFLETLCVVGAIAILRLGVPFACSRNVKLRTVRAGLLWEATLITLRTLSGFA